MPFTSNEADVLRSELSLPPGALNVRAIPLREASVQEAIGWPNGPTVSAQVYTEIYRIGLHSVGVRKPGKEAERPNPNVHDMLPAVAVGGADSGLLPTFQDIFLALENVVAVDHEAAEVLAALLFRQAFMLDHHPDVNGHIRLRLPGSFALFEQRIPTIQGLPSRVYIHFLDVLALNEDVKYLPGRVGAARNAGRTNCLMTCAHVLAVGLGLQTLSGFIGKMTRTKMSPIGQGVAREKLRFLSAS